MKRGTLLFIIVFLFPICCFADNTSMDIMRKTMEEEKEEPKLIIQIGPIVGFFIPYNKDFRDTYGGGGLVYGLSLLGVYEKDYGVKLEVEQIEMERLLPYNEPNKWKNTLTNLSITPFWFSFLKNFQFTSSWNMYFGLGFGASIVKERFRGETLINNEWRWTDNSQIDTLVGIQVLLGILKLNKINFEIKYSYIPRRGSIGFADIGGATVSLCIPF